MVGVKVLVTDFQISNLFNNGIGINPAMQLFSGGVPCRLLANIQTGGGRLNSKRMNGSTTSYDGRVGL